tara:strand:+ start:2230 stop:4008 length:1779 start_codon:yes stop_codon:yes gene_type:complete
MRRPAISMTPDRWIAVGFGLLMVASLLVMSALSGHMSAFAMEADNAMRLVQIQDFLKGQGWFDLHQARLGLEGGTAIHWSRLADVPVLVIKAALDIFLPSQMSLEIACLIWPPLSVLLVVWGLMAGARFIGGRAVLVFVCIIAATVLFRNANFLSGSIDHHNIQLGFLAIATGFSLDPHRRPVSLAVMGATLASSIAVGAEVYPFVGIFCAFHALDWAFVGVPARRGVIAFGVTFATLTAVFFATSVAPTNYGIVHCDALSLVTLSAAVLGGVGLAILVAVLSDRPFAWRLAGLGVLGLACTLLLMAQAPQCLGNPLDGLPPIVQTLWLEKVDEARPLFAVRPKMAQEIPFMVGVPLVALIVSVWYAWRGAQRRANLLFIALLAMDLVLTLQQVRFYSFGHVFAILPLAVWVAGLFTKREEGQRSAGYLLALALSLPLVWGAPGRMFRTPETAAIDNDSRASACASPDMLAALDGLPEGRVLAVADVAPDILRYTGQSALHGHYHRNAAGIEAALGIFTSPPDEAAGLMREAGVDYVLACPGHAEFAMLADVSPADFAAVLNAGLAPEGLQIIRRASDGETLYAVEPLSPRI